MFRKMDRGFPGGLNAPAGRFRFPGIHDGILCGIRCCIRCGILCGLCCLALVSARPSPLAFAQQTVTISGSHTGSAFGNSNDHGSHANTDPQR